MGKGIQDLAAGAQNAHTSRLLYKCVTFVKLTDLLILCSAVSQDPSLNTELDLQSLLGSMCTRFSLAETPQPRPPSLRIWAPMLWRYWSAKIDDISL